MCGPGDPKPESQRQGWHCMTSEDDVCAALPRASANARTGMCGPGDPKPESQRQGWHCMTSEDDVCAALPRASANAPPATPFTVAMETMPRVRLVPLISRNLTVLNSIRPGDPKPESQRQGWHCMTSEDDVCAALPRASANAPPATSSDATMETMPRVRLAPSIRQGRHRRMPPARERWKARCATLSAGHRAFRPSRGNPQRRLTAAPTPPASVSRD